MRARAGRFGVCILLLSLTAAGGCELARDLVPRTIAESVSPDGRHTASVWRAPDDHLFLATRGQPARRLMNLAPDSDWCKTIVWTPDSRKVGFLIADDRLAVFDVETRTLESFFFLAGNGCCGGPQESRNVAFSADGTSVSFDRFERPTVLLRGRGQQFEAHLSRESTDSRPLSNWHVLTPARNLGREVVRIPVSHIRLRLIGAFRERLRRLYVTVVSKDQRSIDVPATPLADGLVNLPATDDGPIDRLEIGFSDGTGRRTIVRDVRADEGETLVNVPHSAR